MDMDNRQHLAEPGEDRLAAASSARPSWAGSRQYIAPWYLAYLILGLINAGVLPFLLPLVMAELGHDLDSIAYVIGAYNIGMLPAPLLGMLAERRRLFRPVFFGGFLVLSLSLACLAAVSNLALWVILALLAGFGVGAIATVAPLFVVDFTPRDEWEPRIGWLQSFYGAGQLAGLLIVGGVAAGTLAYGFWLSAAVAALAIVVGRIGLPVDGRRQPQRLPRLAWEDAMSQVQPAPAIGGLLQHSHHLQGEALRQLPRAGTGGLALFLLAWGSLNLGIAPFFAYYPLMMHKSYGVTPTRTALLYAAAAGVGIGLFALSGRMAQRFGPRAVFRVGLAMRGLGFAGLALLSLVPVFGGQVIAMLAFTLAMLAWPVLSVSSTGLAARLTPIGEGAAMGLLAAVGAVATVLGTFLGGPLVETFGYRVVPMIALAGLLGAELLVRRRSTR
jgi:MFS family permease